MMFVKLSISFLITFVSFKGFPQSVTIDGSLKGVSDGQYAYLYQYFGPQIVKFDSVKIENSRFLFKYQSSIPRGLYRLGISTKQSFIIILGKESLSVKADLKTLENSIEITGSKENNAFKSYTLFNKKMQAHNVSLSQRAKNGDQKTIEVLQKEIDSLRQEQKDFYEEIIKQYPRLYVSKIASAFLEIEGRSADNFFSREVLNDPELIRSDLLFNMTHIYYQNHVARDITGWLQAAELLIEKTEEGSPQREVIYLSIAYIFYSGASDNVWDIAKKYGAEYPQSEHYLNLVKNLPPPTPTVGDQAPDIILSDVNGQTQKLSELRGKYVLVDFWASWCGPCRQENPNVVRAYNKYKDLGFTVYGVSLDRDKEKWLAAIEKDDLTWQHVSDLQGWKSKGAALYGVRGIPASFLVDPKGEIIYKNLRGASLDKTLKKLLIDNNKQ